MWSRDRGLRTTVLRTAAVASKGSVEVRSFPGDAVAEAQLQLGAPFDG
jgi:hypothetical protein